MNPQCATANNHARVDANPRRAERGWLEPTWQRRKGEQEEAEYWETRHRRETQRGRQERSGSSSTPPLHSRSSYGYPHPQIMLSSGRRWTRRVQVGPAAPIGRQPIARASASRPSFSTSLQPRSYLRWYYRMAPPMPLSAKVSPTLWAQVVYNFDFSTCPTPVSGETFLPAPFYPFSRV